MEQAKLVSGQVIEVQNFPFVRVTYEGFDSDGPFSDECWKPGCRHETSYDYDAHDVADGTGAMLLTVISLHKPGKYPERVFFTRQWRDPDGKVFGRKCLRVATKQAFSTMVKGYRYPFVNDDQNGGAQ